MLALDSLFTWGEHRHLCFLLILLLTAVLGAQHATNMLWARYRHGTSQSGAFGSFGARIKPNPEPSARAPEGSPDVTPPQQLLTKWCGQNFLRTPLFSFSSILRWS